MAHEHIEHMGLLRNWLHFHKNLFLRFLTRFNKIWNRLSFSFPKM